MIWLTWRQHRKQALYTAIGIAVLVALMLPTGLHMHSVFTGSGLAGCGSAASRRPDCGELGQQFNNQFGSLGFVAILFMLLPLLVGLFFGAPLIAREVEDGTHRLVWTQGVSRVRWAAVKFGLVGSVAVLLAVVYALGVTWWIAPLASAGAGRFAYGYFDVQGIVPIGYTLFALALGLFVGTVRPKVLPAMALTLGGFTAVRLAVEMLARPHFMAPRTLTYAVTAVTSGPGADRAAGDWVYAEGVRSAAGKLLVSDGQVGCSPGAATPGDLCSSLGPGAYNWEQYQPADRFWAFQGIETGIFLALAALLLWLAVRRIRRIA
ncbi:ABC transporter permease [Kitasatospora sp. NBC_01287]|uniref:ABC transporter permease n=1 Tax=Kitasatospora sp. NBC_01287 TaxID=2903573 RepID=UPI00225C05DA|nr:ABC transporter permease subunit [Kitasatospora sp. NBC_01287]MCX4749952.1 ABC transporter permease [Kitasatospora sp. NBC_01287]